MEIITNNYEWIFSGVGVLIIGYIITFFLPNKNQKQDIPIINTPNSNTNTNSFVVNNIMGNTNQIDKSSTENTDDRLKGKTKILFIDDNHTEYKMVSILKKSGWINTKSVKDVIDLDDPKVNEADIIFVDINGVGTTMFQDQGLGLASALKKKYESKKIILYSAEITGDRFHRALREVDGCLSKNAEPYQFINLIEEFAK
ncbi:response regulatory protein [Flavobacterium psychrophilum]|uniref:Probable two-component system response regulatory protein n=1 Tax=Flavobacterium psychrophilum (strain ATCC 49511 / DSM 21280 / CIP 103535 / JIP02/86) TaxID=402612 RepID=A6GXY2_FLAPJ|nr:response regulator [Flavobacterium psychrophilum]AIG29683.1 response regulatory protein [Flavobacterium psychrophilum]AIG31960.1 response regulatory protein [Flavobacterium psychrophilum]AIG34115.1 response regulatory protein [Flavobacterium psychrophilum]AIG36478.1 response regulatory protein [Flavobacterium psychrophilum]AIG38743.1 response regulatory protein [Flavobacterium psychrophilum]